MAFGLEVVCNRRFVFSLWKLFFGKILTLDQLQKRGFSLANRCYMCHENDEIVEHLILHCV